jgi:Holliday junction resolvasome RuvABC endonuclease subunit
MVTSVATLFLGIDPSPRSTGLALVGSDGSCEAALVTPPKGCLGAARLAFHRNALREFLKTRKVSGAAIEGPSLKSQNQPDKLGQVRGVYMLAIQDLGLVPTEVAPKSAKKFFTGSGAASKEKMIAEAQRRWPGVTFNEDTADAAGLAAVAKALTEDSTNLRRKEIEALRGIRGHGTKTCKPTYRERGIDV